MTNLSGVAVPKPKRKRSKRGPSAGQKAMIRAEVFGRDDYRCQHWIGGQVSLMGRICGRPITWDSGHLHHLKHRSRGGGWELDNLQTLCVDCHAKVHSYSADGSKPVPKKERA